VWYNLDATDGVIIVIPTPGIPRAITLFRASRRRPAITVPAVR